MLDPLDLALVMLVPLALALVLVPAGAWARVRRRPVLLPEQRHLLASRGLRATAEGHVGTLAGCPVELTLGATEVSISAGWATAGTDRDPAVVPVGPDLRPRPVIRALDALAAFTWAGEVTLDERSVRFSVPAQRLGAGGLERLLDALEQAIVQLGTPCHWREVIADVAEAPALRLHGILAHVVSMPPWLASALSAATDDPRAEVRAIAQAHAGRPEALREILRDTPSAMAPAAVLLPWNEQVDLLSHHLRRGPPTNALLAFYAERVDSLSTELLRALVASLRAELATRTAMFGAGRFDDLLPQVPLLARMVQRLEGEVIEGGSSWLEELFREADEGGRAALGGAIGAIGGIDDVPRLRSLATEVGGASHLEAAVRRIQARGAGEVGSLALASAAGGELSLAAGPLVGEGR